MIATYTGSRCGRCGKLIEKGQFIQSAGGRTEHAPCPLPAEGEPVEVARYFDKPNQHPGPCVKCGASVEAFGGKLVKCAGCPKHLGGGFHPICRDSGVCLDRREARRQQKLAL